MTNPSFLSNQSLLQNIKSLVSGERRLSLEILWHLREIESRRLFLDLGFSSLYEYCLRELNYSEGQAQRRISSSRLLKELPALEEKVKLGSLSLTTLSQAQSFFKKEEKINERSFSNIEKLGILKTLEAKSKLEVERTLLNLSRQPLSHKPDQERQISEDHIELRITITRELKRKLDKLRHLYSHKNPQMSYQELLEELAALALKVKDPAQPKSTKTSALENRSPQTMQTKHSKHSKHSVEKQSTPQAESTEQRASQHGATFPRKGEPPRSRYIPASIRRVIWQRDQGQCQYQDPESKRKCQSKYLIQIDHKYPFALGGENTLENLRLLCSSHNQNQARKIFLGLESNIAR